jgi:hypothetical protein
MRLIGRRRECEQLDGLLAAVRGGAGRVLVLRGEPGVGKSALLEYAAERADDFRVLHAAGVQSELELAYAGLHQLLGSLLGRLPDLPGPQRDALETVFGISRGWPVVSDCPGRCPCRGRSRRAFSGAWTRSRNRPAC